MAEAAGVEALEKIKKVGGIMKNVVTTTRNMAFEMVGDTKSEVQDLVDKTKAAALEVKTSGNSLVQGVKNWVSVFSKSPPPPEGLVKGVPEAGLPKGQVNFTTGRIQEGSRRTRRKRGGSRRQNASKSREGMSNQNSANMKKVYLMLDQQSPPEYMSLHDLIEHQKKLNSGEINVTTQPEKSTKVNPKKNNASVIILPNSEVQTNVNSQGNSVTGFTVKGSPMSIKNTLNAYKNFNPKNNAPTANAPAANAPVANKGAKHKYVEAIADANGDIYYTLPNGETTWDKPEGDYTILPKGWGVNASGNSIKFVFYNTGKTVSNVPTANTATSNGNNKGNNKGNNGAAAPVVEEEAPSPSPSEAPTLAVNEANNGGSEAETVAVGNQPSLTPSEAPTVAVNGNSRENNAFRALMTQINSLESKLKEIKANTEPAASGGRRRRHRTRRRGSRRSTRRRGTSRRRR
jgi:hypothetical protein